MDLQDPLNQIQGLSDLELATLLCLIARQNCLIETDERCLDDLASELALIVSEVFGLSYAVLSAEDFSSIESFGDIILEQDLDFDSPAARVQSEGETTNLQPPEFNWRNASVSQSTGPDLDTRKVVNVVIAKDFNLAAEEVQIQILELIRRKRIYSRTTVHPAPEVFAIIGLVATESKSIRLNKYLNDRMFISHYHDPEDGFPNLEELDGGYLSDDQESSPSIAPQQSSQSALGSGSRRRIRKEVIDRLRELGEEATITPEVRRYQQDLIVFLRLERGVDGGVSPYATVQFQALAKYLAPLHGVNYVTPSLVALAAKKIYPHRIDIAGPKRERSMQYGGDYDATQELLHDVTPESVIEAVLNTVDCPL